MSQSSPMEERVDEEVGLECFESVMTIADLERLRSLCFIPGEFGLTLASIEDRIHVPSAGSIGVYEEAMKADLRFPLHLFIKRVMDRFSLSLAQVASNSWRYIVGFVCLYRMIGIRPTMDLFR